MEIGSLPILRERKAYTSAIRIIVFLVFICSFVSCSKQPNNNIKPTLRIATGSPYELGLLGKLVKKFNKEISCTVKITKAGSGRALDLLKKGVVDVVLVHAPKLERNAIRKGWAIRRVYIGANSFVIVGPENDPARIKEADSVFDAYNRILKSHSVFISRGDNSGTFVKENSIWKNLGTVPVGKWYMKTHSFMMKSLLEASKLGGYFMCDNSTYWVAKSKYPKLKSKILYKNDPYLINRYHALISNPKFNTKTNYIFAKKFEDFLVSTKAQHVISTFGKKEFGHYLYFDRNHRFATISILHAGSLSVPFEKLEKGYEASHDGVEILRESYGSRKCARMITELRKPCDIMASADVAVITNMLIPKYTNWCALFATNEMVIAFTKNSTYSNSINSNNWYQILTQKNVSVGMADPNLDPCGYRTIMVLQLAEKLYKIKNLKNNILKKASVRPKAVELLGLLESNNLDYAFEYKSVAIQHGLLYVKLPNEINLTLPSMNKLYEKATVKLMGKKSGNFIIRKGHSIEYGITVLSNAPNRRFALEFVKYLLDRQKGLKIIEENGQNPIIPVKFIGKIPGYLKY